MATTNETMTTRRFAGSTGVIIVLVLLALAGVGVWIYQLVQGMAVTGLSQQVVWALYIAAFFSAVGAGAGMLFLIGVSEFTDLIPANVRRLGLMAALASFVAGALLIMLDIGNPLQVWRIITAGRFSSLMTWDFWLLLAAGLVTLVYLFTAAKSGLSKVLGVLAMVGAVAVVVVEAWMLSSLSARPLWAGGLTVISFLLAALTGGLALWLLVDEGKPSAAVKWFRLAMVASLVVVAAEVVTRLVGGAPATAQEILSLVLTGTAAPAFWFQVLAGLALPLVLVATGRYLKLAAALALLGVLAEKIWMLVAGQALSWLELPAGSYFFTWVELVAVIGVIAIGVLVYLGLNRLLPQTEA